MAVLALALTAPAAPPAQSNKNTPATPPAAQVRFRHLDAESGLSNSWVRSILKDSRGFLWVGTQDGLNRYDGSDFAVYRYAPGDPRGFPFAVVSVLYEDSRRRLWVGSGWEDGGVALYDRDLDRFERLPVGPQGLSGGRVYAILEDRTRRIWVGTEKGLDRVDVEAGAYEHHPLGLPAGGEVSGSVVYALHEDREGTIWVGSHSGLLRFDPQSGSHEHWKGRADQPLGPDNTPVWDLLEDEDGRIWVASIGGGLFRIDPRSGAQEQYAPKKGDAASLSHTRVRRLARGQDGRLWIGTENGGLNVLDPATSRFTRYLPDPGNADALTSASIWDLYSDGQGILWVGTYNGGLNYTSPSGFDVIRAGSGGLSSPHVTSLLEDRRGDLWVGTDGGGLDRIDGRSGAVTRFRHDPHDPGTIGSDAVFGLAEDDSGAIWVGAWDGGVSRLDPATGRASRLRHQAGRPASLVSDNVWHIHRLRSGEILVATEGGVDLLDPRQRTFRRLSSLYPAVGAFQTSVSAEDAAGNLWLGRRRRGLQRIDRATGAVTEYVRDPGDPDVRGYGWITSLHVDRAGNVWFGTDRGLGCVPGGSGTVRRFTTADGLADDRVASLAEDAAGQLWVGTLAGLSQMVDAVQLPREPKFVNYDVEDGLQGNQSSAGAALRASSGRLYFGGENGLTVFDPAAIRHNREPPRVVLTELRIFNEPVVPGAPGSPLARSITETDSVELSRDASLVTFEFAALNFLAPRKNRYAYRLEGVDRDWTRTGSQRSADYAHLPAGSYVFRVRAANNDGVWNDEGATLRVIVRPRWYERAFVPPLAVALLAAAGVVRYRRRVVEFRARELELRRRVDERTRELHTLNESLEQRVEARTAELAAKRERLAAALAALREASQRFETVFRGAPVGIAIASPEGRCLEANEQLLKMLSQPRERMRELNFLDITHPDDRERSLSLMQAVRAGATDTYELEKRYLRSDGAPVWCRLHASPVRTATGEVDCWIDIIEDVTEHRRMDEERARLQAQLFQAQKLESVGRLAGGVAHDFNNMLHVIGGFTDLLRLKLPAGAELSDYVAEIERAVRRAQEITRQLLAFSRRQVVSPVPSDLDELIARLSKALSRLIGEDVVLRIAGTPVAWRVNIDPTQFEQVLLNLAINARDAMPQGGSLTLETANIRLDEGYCRQHCIATPGEYVLLAVSDDGIGMDAETRARIFDPFFTTKEKGKGTGLGLAMVHGIVEQNGGFVNVYSEPGQGTTFRIYLPRTTAEPGVSTESLAEPGAAGGGTILVVEDDAPVRRLTVALLESMGYTVVAAAGGEEAIAVCQCGEPPIDVVLTDVVMPGMSGRELRDRLRAVRPEVKVLFTSGYTANVIAHHGVLDKDVHFVAKPFGVQDIAKALHDLSAAAPARQASSR